MRSCDVEENSLDSWSGGPPTTILALRGLSLPESRANLLETRAWKSVQWFKASLNATVVLPSLVDPGLLSLFA